MCGIFFVLFCVAWEIIQFTLTKECPCVSVVMCPSCDAILITITGFLSLRNSY